MIDDQLIMELQHSVGGLIEGRRALLEAMLDAEGVLHSREEDGKERDLDKQGADEIIEVLDGESDKVSRLEITLAVAGTAKAGKSTAVNAIIGTEVLPNRARPMTTLPTVIRHEPNRREPRLTVNKAAAHNRIAKKISEKLQDKGCQEKVRKAHGIDMADLIDELAAGSHLTIGGDHEGRGQVFKVLARINDMMRLGRHPEVGVELPIEEYDELDEMPSLHVHFRCLADEVSSTSGSLALLDLPGFNEAKWSDHLTALLKEQLEKASAILVILDYTQLNTSAAEDLEMLIDAVSGMMTDRIYVLVNKYDQHTTSDPYRDVDVLRKHISDDTMKGQVDPKHVYPVSAKKAYLASRALDALDQSGCLPSPDDEPWVTDFGELVCLSDAEKLADSGESRKMATALWEAGKFDEPLKEVVMKARSRAAMLSIQSALAKLDGYSEDMEKSLKLSKNSLTAGIEVLKRVIEKITGNIESISKVEDKFLSDFNKSIEGVKSEIQQTLAKSKKKFDFHRLFSTIGEGELEYRDKKDYVRVKERINKLYSGIAKQGLDAVFTNIEGILSGEKEKIAKILDKNLRGILEEAQTSLADIDVQAALKVPKAKLEREKGEVASAKLSTNIGKWTEIRTRPGKGFWKSFWHFFSDKWGLEEYGVEKTSYVIDRSETIRILKESLAETFKNYQMLLEDVFKQWKGDCGAQFKEIEKYLSRYQTVLWDRFKDQEGDQNRLERIIKNVRELENRCENNRGDILQLKEVAEGL